MTAASTAAAPSERRARAAGLYAQHGHLMAGAHANIALLDRERLDVQHLIIDGVLTPQETRAGGGA